MESPEVKKATCLNSVTCAFERIYVNPDSSFLVRKEETRLSDLLKDLTPRFDDSVHLYIRGRIVYRNKEIVDKVDVKFNLLF